MLALLEVDCQAWRLFLDAGGEFLHYVCYIVRYGGASIEAHLQAYHLQHVKGPARFFSGTHAVSAMIALARKHPFSALFRA